jgi:membrane-bound lytic murein transglycosylase D
MMKRFLLFTACLWLGILRLSGQAVGVPEKIEVANLQLRLDEASRNKIQQMVSGIAGDPAIYWQLADRARLYLPFVAQALQDEKLPADLQFVALQESGLLAEAVSKGGVTGFFPTSDSLAKVAGLRINSRVDERRHIQSAATAWAKQVKAANQQTRNWLFAAYAAKVGTAQAVENLQAAQMNSQQVQITADMPRYIHEYVAYVLAFRGRIPQAQPSDMVLMPYPQAKGKRLDELAEMTGLSYDDLKAANSWLTGNTVPSDDDYVLYLPVNEDNKQKVMAALQLPPMAAVTTDNTLPAVFQASEQLPYPKLTNQSKKQVGNKTYIFATANGIKAMIGGHGDTAKEMAAAAGVSFKAFLKHNDLDDNDAIKPYQVYYLDEKKEKAEVAQHIIRGGESFWDVSQRYGIKLKELAELNRLTPDEAAKEGRILFLQNPRPESTEVAYAAPETYVPPVAEKTGNLVDQILEAKTDTTDKETIDPTAMFHTVRLSADGQVETIYQISQLYKVSINDLRQLNALGENLELTAGQTLRIRNEVAAAEEEIKAITGNTTDTGSVPTTNTATDTTANTNLTDPTANTGITDPTNTSVPDSALTNTNPPTSTDTSSPNIGNVATIGDNAPKTADTVKVAVEALPMTHKVQAGETLYKVAKKYKVRVADLITLNKLNPQDPDIRVGQELKLQASTEDVGQFHTVQAGESLYAIATRYSLSVKSLAQFNNLDENNPKILPNMVLRLTPPSAGMLGSNLPPKVKNDTTFHKVQKGETMFGIAKKYNLSLAQLEGMNKGTKSIVPNQKLIVKMPQTAPDEATQVIQVVPQKKEPQSQTSPTTNTPAGTQTQPTAASNTTADNDPNYYSAKKGEFYYQIAEKYTISVDNLRKWNNIEEYDASLDADRRLRITPPPAQTQVPSTQQQQQQQNSGVQQEINNATQTQTNPVATTQTDSNPAATEQPAANTQTASANNNGGQRYTPQMGDTPSDVAQKFGITEAQVRAWNNLPEGQSAFWGSESLIVSAGGNAGNASDAANRGAELPKTDAQSVPQPVVSGNTATQGNPKTHTVEHGESLISIAEKHGITVADLIKWNQLSPETQAVATNTILIVSGDNSGNTSNVGNTTITSEIGTQNNTTPLPSPLPTTNVTLVPVTDKPNPYPNYAYNFRAVRYHVVQTKENFYALANKYNVPDDTLKIWNRLADASKIDVGDTLIVEITREVRPLAKNAGTHFVRSGETLNTIATLYGIAPEQLFHWNQLNATTVLKENDMLRVKSPEAIAQMPYVSYPADLYIAQEGDNIYSLAEKFSLRLGDLKRWNNIPTGSIALEKGRAVVVKEPSLLSSYYKTKANENVYTLAENTNSRIADVRAWNAIPQQVNALPEGFLFICRMPVIADSLYITADHDNVYTVAEKFNLLINEFRAWNNLPADLTDLPGGLLLTTKKPAVMPNPDKFITSSTPLTELPKGHYRTGPNDNIYSVAERFEVRVTDLKKWNNLPIGMIDLPEGKVLMVTEEAYKQVAPYQAPESALEDKKDNPSETDFERPTPKKPKVVYHLVAKGETLFSIAQKYKIDAEVLRNWNNRPNNSVKEGESLIVSK